jgi:hypothetical protein
MPESRTVSSSFSKLLIFAGLFLLGCAYEPSEEFFNEVKSIEPLFSIDLSEYNDRDTILLEQPTTFGFNVDISHPSTIQIVEVLLDSKPLIASYSGTGVFTLSQSDIALGHHLLTIQFMAKSNSGSLADKLDAENFQIWRSWVLNVVRYDNDPPPTPELNITEMNGRLRLDWTRFTKKNFISYKLSVSGSPNREIVFNDSLSTFWVDSSFLWGSASYELTVTNAFGSASSNAYINEEQKFTLIYNSSDSTAFLKWKPSRFYNAFKNVVITENQTPRETISSASDSTFTLKLKEVLWGRSESVMLQVLPKDPQQNVFESREFFNPVTNSRINGVPTLYYQSGRVIGHSSQYGLVYFYDDEMNVTDSVGVFSPVIAVPYSGNYVYYVDGNRIVRWNVVTDNKTYFNDQSGFIIEPHSIHGSSNGLASYFSLNTQVPWDQRVSEGILNTNDNSFIVRTNSSYDPKINIPPQSRVLSDEGGFSLDVNGRNNSRIEANNLVPIGTLPYLGAFFSYRPDNNDEILLKGYESISIISSIDLQLQRSIQLPTGYSMTSYDPVTHYAVCTKTEGTVVYLINIDTNDTRTVPAYSTGWQLMNGYLFNYASQYIKVL